MKVKALISKLEGMNQDAEVRLHHPLGSVALFALAVKGNDDVVWLESVEDINLKEELYAQYENAVADGLDYDVIAENLKNIGFTWEQIEANLDEEICEHLKEVWPV